jgi:XTP/dITP diphosphohydrolase
VAVSWPGEPVELYTGECSGMIVRRPRGEKGFGYDPVFLFPQLGKTMAELPLDEKNRISHRSAAVRKALKSLKRRAAATGYPE